MTATRELAYVDAIGEALQEEMRRDPSVYVIAEDVTVKQLERAAKGLASEFGADRMLDGPIAETAILASAFGSAITGMRPVAEIASINFITVCMDPIVNHMAKYRYATARGDLSLPIVVRTQTGNAGPVLSQGPHHEQSLEAWFTHVPGLKVVMPSDAYDAKGLLKSAIRGDDPVFYIEHRLLPWVTAPVPEEEYLVPIGKAKVKRSGDDITVVTWSRDVHLALQAAETLGPARHQPRGGRPADPGAAGRGRHPRVGRQDRPAHRRPRGLQDRRLRRGDRRGRRREGLSRSEGPHQAGSPRSIPRYRRTGCSPPRSS